MYIDGLLDLEQYVGRAERFTSASHETAFIEPETAFIGSGEMRPANRIIDKGNTLASSGLPVPPPPRAKGISIDKRHLYLWVRGRERLFEA